MVNLFQKLLAPTEKLAGAAEKQVKELEKLNILTTGLNEKAIVRNEELSMQTVLLTDIKNLIKAQANAGGADDAPKNKFGDASNFKGLKPNESKNMVALVVGAAISIVAAAALMAYIPTLTPMKMLTAIAVAGVLAIVAPIMVKIAKQLSGSTSEMSVEGDSMNFSQSSGGGLAGAGTAILSLIGMSLAVTLSSWILTMVAPLTPIQFITALAVAALFIPMAFAFSMITKSLSKAIGTKSAGVEGMSFSGTDTSGLMPLLGASLLAILGMTVAVVGTSWLLQLMAPVGPAQFLSALGISLILIGLSFALSKIMLALKSGKIKADLQGVAMVGMVALIMVAGITALVVSSWLIQGMAVITPAQFLTGVAIGLMMIPIAWAMSMLIQGLAKAKIKPDMNGVKMIGMAALAMVAIAMGIVGASYILLLLPDTFKAPPLMWSISVGLALVAFGWAYAQILKVIQGKSLKDLGMATLGLILVGVALLGVAYILTMWPGTLEAPDAMWTLKVGLALFIFAIPFVLITILFKKMGIGLKEMGMGLLGMVAVAIGVLAVAWILSITPDEYGTPPPVGWSFGAAAALLLFAVPVAAIGLIATSGIGFAAIALGVVGMIVIAIGILAVAWIFSVLPDLGEIGANLTAFILAPINGIVDVLVRLKDEVGVSNLLPLAGGIAAISVALLLLAGATAGLAAGGVISALGNAASEFVDGIVGFFGGKKSKGPLDILDDLIRKRNKINGLAEPLHKIADALGTFIRVERSIKALNSVLSTLVTLGMSPNMLQLAVSAIQGIASGMSGLREAMKGFTVKPLKVLMTLFKMVPLIQHTAKAMGELAAHFSSFAMSALIAGTGLQKIANAFVKMTAVTPEQVQPAIDFFNVLVQDTYMTQAIAFEKMAPAIAMILNGGQKASSFKELFVGKDKHPFIQIMEALTENASAIISSADPLSSISKAHHSIAVSPAQSIIRATKMFQTLADSSFDKQAKALNSIAKSVNSIATGSDAINIGAIDSTTEMFKALAYLSASGGDGAIAALGDNLIGAIQELANIMSEFANTVADGVDGQKGILEKVVDTVTGTGNSPGNRPAPASAAADSGRIVSAIKKLQSTLTDQGIKVNKSLT